MACSHPTSHWITREVRSSAVEVQVCSRCNRALRLSRFILPYPLLERGQCANCGAPRVASSDDGKPVQGLHTPESPACSQCGLSARDDYRVHLALARKVSAANLLGGARAAARQGRHAIALKLATAGFHFEDDPLLGRALRLQAFDAIGAIPQLANEALALVHTHPPAPTLATTISDMLLQRGLTDTALTVLSLGIEETPEDGTLHLERAEIFQELGHWPGAVSDATICIRYPVSDIANAGMEILVRAATRYHLREDWRSLYELFDNGAPETHGSARLAYLRACGDRARGDLSLARKWMLHSVRLDPKTDDARSAVRALDEVMGLEPSPLYILLSDDHRPG